jgi:hypothetical protein
MSGSAPYPGDNIVGWVAFHLPHAIAFAERKAAAIDASARYWRAVYAARGFCPVRHRLDDPSCGYCTNARSLIVARNAEAYL